MSHLKLQTCDEVITSAFGRTVADLVSTGEASLCIGGSSESNPTCLEIRGGNLQIEIYWNSKNPQFVFEKHGENGYFSYILDPDQVLEMLRNSTARLNAQPKKERMRFEITSTIDHLMRNEINRHEFGINIYHDLVVINKCTNKDSFFLHFTPKKIKFGDFWNREKFRTFVKGGEMDREEMKPDKFLLLDPLEIHKLLNHLETKQENHLLSSYLKLIYRKKQLEQMIEHNNLVTTVAAILAQGQG